MHDITHRFDDFDLQIQSDESPDCETYLHEQEYLSTLNGLDDECKRELSEVEMQCDRAEAEVVGSTMAQLDRGPIQWKVVR